MPARTATIATIIAGETARLTIPLLEDDAALNGTGFTVSDFLLTGNDGTSVDTTGVFGWAFDAAGTVYFDPPADLSASLSPYRVRVEVTDGNLQTRYYPNNGIAQIKVLAAR